MADLMENQPASEKGFDPVEMSGSDLTSDVLKSSWSLRAAVRGEIW